MEPHASKIVINGATSQYDRWLTALDVGYAQVDGRSFDELLGFAVRYGALVNFYNLRDRPDGDWVLFFLTDPTVMLATVAATDLAKFESVFTKLERQTAATRDFERKFQLLHDTFAAVIAPARLINSYLLALGQGLEGGTYQLFRQRIVEAVEGDLGAQLRTLKAYDEGAGLPGALGRPIGLDYSGFSPLWGLGPVCPDGSIYRGRTDDRKIDHALPHLDPIFYSFLYALSDLRQFALEHLTDTLDGGRHKPQVALYMAFATLFRSAQDTINKTSARYVDFYYRDMLRERERGPIPDSVFLTFTLQEDEEVTSASVPGDTLFPAGQDADGRDILYASDKSLVVTPATIGKLRTLRVVTGNLSCEMAADPASGGDAPASLVQRVLASEITPPATPDASGAQAEGWATFGEVSVGTSEVEVTEPATLGFAVASDYLLLTGGTRDVQLEVGYPADFQENVLDPLLAQLSDATGLCTDEILHEVLKAAFTLYVSTSAGWFEVAYYGVATTLEEEVVQPSFGLWFELTPGVPPVVPYDPQGEEADADAPAQVTDDPRVNATNPAPSLPTLKVYLRQEPVVLSGKDGTASVDPLALLAGMEVTSLRIRVEVHDFTQLQLENTDGEVDASTPFMPFGGLPVVGSYLLVRQRELFVKKLETLRLTLTWFNLPQNEDGFKGYYKYYVIGLDGRRESNLFNNQVFRGLLSVQSHGPWSFSPSVVLSPESAGDDVYLFRTRDNCADPVPTEDGALCVDTVFAPEIYPAKSPSYYDPAQSAVRLELTGPPYAFGYSIYAQNVLSAVIEDLPDPARCQEECEAKCSLLVDASLCIDVCLACLGGGELSGASLTASAQTCVENCLKCLALLAAPCIELCSPESGLPSAAQTRPSASERVSAFMKLSDEQRARFIRQCMEGCSGRTGVTSPPPVPDQNVCLQLFETILCVIDCKVSPTSPPMSLEDCLRGCKERLEMARKACFDSCVNECMSLKGELQYPNEPYLPQATKLAAHYTATCIIPTTSSPPSQDCGQFFHLLPFGGYRRLDLSAQFSPLLLPSFSYPGNLYIGFTGLTPPQTLTLLFQLTGDPGGAAPEPPPTVVWEYLSDNLWTPLQQSQVLADTTNGLQNTGIVTLGLPSYDPSGNTVLAPVDPELPADSQWLRACVEGDPARFPDTVGIYPHAALATWQNYDNTGEHLAKPLPPYTITGSVQDLPDISGINQPVESFGGSPPETARGFQVRVGERLRHKDRAVLGRDYELLVLERFPTVWKVQTLPARNPLTGESPGEVTVVVVSGPNSIQAVDSTAPTATAELLATVRTYLEERASPFVQLHVVNPVYVRIEVSAAVRFRSEATQGASVGLLNDELVQYLSPWFYDAARAAKGGRYVSEADISEFIQTRPYVETMDWISFNYEPEPDNLDWYFLTSARQHKILDAGSTAAPSRTGY
jgi:hypothetical protein